MSLYIRQRMRIAKSASSSILFGPPLTIFFSKFGSHFPVIYMSGHLIVNEALYAINKWTDRVSLFALSNNVETKIQFDPPAPVHVFL